MIALQLAVVHVKVLMMMILKIADYDDDSSRKLAGRSNKSKERE